MRIDGPGVSRLVGRKSWTRVQPVNQGMRSDSLSGLVESGIKGAGGRRQMMNDVVWHGTLERAAALYPELPELRRALDAAKLNTRLEEIVADDLENFQRELKVYSVEFRHRVKAQTASPEEVAHTADNTRHWHGGHDYPLLPQPQPIQNTIPHPQKVEIVTPKELAQRLHVPEPWVYEKTRTRCKNPLPCLRIGRFIRFDWSAVLDWLEKQSSK
jgi:hypothetical protein